MTKNGQATGVNHPRCPGWRIATHRPRRNGGNHDDATKNVRTPTMANNRAIARGKDVLSGLTSASDAIHRYAAAAVPSPMKKSHHLDDREHLASNTLERANVAAQNATSPAYSPDSPAGSSDEPDNSPAMNAKAPKTTGVNRTQRRTYSVKLYFLLTPLPRETGNAVDGQASPPPMETVQYGLQNRQGFIVARDNRSAACRAPAALANGPCHLPCSGSLERSRAQWHTTKWTVALLWV